MITDGSMTYSKSTANLKPQVFSESCVRGATVNWVTRNYVQLADFPPSQ